MPKMTAFLFITIATIWFFGPLGVMNMSTYIFKGSAKLNFWFFLTTEFFFFFFNHAHIPNMYTSISNVMLSYFRLESRIHALGYPIFWSEKWVGNRVMLNLQARHDHTVQHLQTLKPTFVPKYPLSDAHPWDECKFVGGTKIVLVFFFQCFFAFFLNSQGQRSTKAW